MKKMIAALLALALTGLHAQALVQSFENIQYWVGSGPHRAALVLQWNDGLEPVSVAWGYRWDGQATGMDMLRAIAGSTRIEDSAGDPVGTSSGADGRLSLGLVEYSFGLSVLSLEYLPGDGGERTQRDWFSGYWEYLICGGNFEYYDWLTEDTALFDQAGSSIYAPGTWSSSPVGASDRPLIDGAWDAYGFAAKFTTQPVGHPVAAKLPVPAASFLMDRGQPSVAVLSQTSFIYQLEYSDDVAGPWNPMGDGELGTGGELIFQDESADLPLERFYRITVRQVP
jgi:hypothetical protein